MRDPQLVLMEMADGVLVEVESFVNCRYGYDVRCEVVGSDGHRHPGEPDRVVGDHRRAPARRRCRPTGGCASTRRTTSSCRSGSTASRAGVVAGPSAWDGYAATAVGEACVRALATGGRVEVDLGAQPALYAAAGDDVKLALDPYMLRSVPLLELPGVVADLGYEHIELSPREDFTPFFLHPRAGHGARSGSSRPRSTPPASRSRATCRCTAGPGPTRTSGRRRCATGSARSS